MRAPIRRIGYGLIAVALLSVIAALPAAAGTTPAAPIAQGNRDLDKTLAASATGYFRVINQNSLKCVDRKDEDGNVNGARAQQYHCVSSDNQAYAFLQNAEGYYELQNKATGTCLTIVLGQAVHWSCSGFTEQQWRAVTVATVPKTMFYLVNRATGECLDVPNASTADRVFLQDFGCNLTGAQIFSTSSF